MPDSVLPRPALAENWRARYRADDAPTEAPWNAVLETLIAHRSVRAFLPDAVPADTIATAMAAAQSASTSSNLQTWSVIAVADPARRARLSGMAAGQAFIREAPLFLVWCADLARLGQIATREGKTAGASAYLEALLLGVVDASLASQNAVVAFESLGYGTVYVGAVRNRPEEIAAELALPAHVFAVFGMAVGRPDPTRPADIKPRLPQAAVLHNEQYDEVSQLAAIDAYGDRLRAFQREQGMREEDWAKRCLNRMADSSSLTGRDRIRVALETLGFPLR